MIADTRDDEPPQPLAAAFPGRLRTVSVDITETGTLRSVLDDAITGFGRLDVVVNNAGYALAGPFGELDDAELRAQFEVNSFSAAHVLRAALPHLRAAKAGRVPQISSLAGQIGAPGMSAYTAGKRAFEGLSVSLATELTPLGIRTTIVEPGAARTDFRADWASRLPGSAALPDYLPAHEALPRSVGAVGGQAGDPARMAQTLVVLADMLSPPLRLPLGSDAVTGIAERPQRPTRRTTPIRDAERFHRPHKGDLTCPSTAPPAVSPSSPAAARAWAWPSPLPSPATERT
ncbi:SDR family NAD(P)-dependent oxidoreductase [Streptomyces nogalater]|uniref:SDR family NAD(P)-dependent oxidoreductase n=1 Tax=Streptomyces nogalater TaxID=38314 RepID=A0ABW0WVQ3_STRNO